MKAFNVFDGELDLSRDRPGFSWRRAMVGEQIGAEKLGASLYELEPGERTFPYHYEYGSRSGSSSSPVARRCATPTASTS